MGRTIAGPARVAAWLLSAAAVLGAQQRVESQGGPSLPPLKPLTADSPLDTIYFADRVPHQQIDDEIYEGTAFGQVLPFVIPSGPGGTETTYVEAIRYQIPVDYDPQGPARPLVVAYHGFGTSANSVSNQSTVDEECNARGWFYLAPTGLDDQLFGTPIVQQHVRVAIQWMLDTFNIDPDRIYMVGFSMGGGIVTSFASRHRDPQGIMIAAVGTVAGTFDWALTYARSPNDLKTLMHHELNFGGPPSTELFAYQASSTLYFAPPYPPSLGSVSPAFSMGVNLHDVPTYLVVDDTDPIPETILGAFGVDALLQSKGGEVQFELVSGTVDPGPPAIPAPHSWLILDEVQLFDFFEGRTAQRYPETFEVLAEKDGATSWTVYEQDTPEAFVRFSATADAAGLAASGVENVASLTADAGLADIAGVWPVELAVENADPDGELRLRLTGFDLPPHRLVDPLSGQLVTLVDSDPATGSLLRTLPPATSLSADVVHDPEWTTVLTIAPQPAALSQTVDVSIDAPPTSAVGFLFVTSVEQLADLEGVWITAFPSSPALLLPLGLDPQGDALMQATVPNDAALHGIRLPMQVVTITSRGVVESVSNHWGFYVD